jgi:pyruvate carboxylase
VLAYLRGELGQPAGGLPQPFARRALRDGGGLGGSKQPDDEPDDPVGSDGLEGLDGDRRERREALSKLLFPAAYRNFADNRERYGDVSVIPSRLIFYGLQTGRAEEIELEPGIRLIVELEAIGEADDRGMRNVLLSLNGQLRTIDVRDESVVPEVAPMRRADPEDPDQIAAPLAGVVTLQVAEGDEVGEGQPVAVLEAMKMESTITAPRRGRIDHIAAQTGRRLETGDLILTLASA